MKLTKQTLQSARDALCLRIGVSTAGLEQLTNDSLPLSAKLLSEKVESDKAALKEIEDVLPFVDIEHDASEQMSFNFKWLMERVDAIHSNLCPEKIGTWQQRAEQAVEASKKPAVGVAGDDGLTVSWGLVDKNNHDGPWYRYDFDSCESGEQQDRYHETQEMLRSRGWELVDPCIEHDCISGILTSTVL